MRTAGIIGIALALLATNVGCKTLIGLPFVLWGKEPTRDVEAEYPYLPGKSVAVAVWADAETRFEYPHLELEVAQFVTDALKASVEDVTLMKAEKVVDFQRRNPNWDRMDPATLGGRFDVDRLIILELTQYTTREPESPFLFRGRIIANVKVYDSDYPNTQPQYSGHVETVYPKESHGEWGETDRSIRRETMKAFATDVAGLFYDREVKAE